MYISRDHRFKFPNKTVLLSLKLVFVLANSVDTNEMLHNAAFHLDIHCFLKYTFRSQYSH